MPDGWSVEYETQRAVDYITESDEDEPFFLYLNYSPPHPPISDCPEKYLKMYDPASLTLRPNVDEANGFPGDRNMRVYRWDFRYYELELPYTLESMDYNVRNIYADYYGNVSWLDDNIGKVMEALEAKGLRDDTIVVFTADHGDNLGSHCKCGKGLPHDESLRIPMIYSHPNGQDARVDEANLAGLIDVAPTLLGAAGVDVPDHMAGTNVLNGEAPTAIVGIHPGNAAVRSRRFTAHAKFGEDSARLAFFDNDEDPYQLNNLVDTDSFAEEQERLFELLEVHDRDVPIMPEPDYGFKETWNRIW